MTKTTVVIAALIAAVIGLGGVGTYARWFERAAPTSPPDYQNPYSGNYLGERVPEIQLAPVRGAALHWILAILQNETSVMTNLSEACKNVSGANETQVNQVTSEANVLLAGDMANVQNGSVTAAGFVQEAVGAEFSCAHGYLVDSTQARAKAYENDNIMISAMDHRVLADGNASACAAAAGAADYLALDSLNFLDEIPNWHRGAANGTAFGETVGADMGRAYRRALDAETILKLPESASSCGSMVNLTAAKALVSQVLSIPVPSPDGYVDNIGILNIENEFVPETREAENYSLWGAAAESALVTLDWETMSNDDAANLSPLTLAQLGPTWNNTSTLAHVGSAEELITAAMGEANYQKNPTRLNMVTFAALESLLAPNDAMRARVYNS